MIKPVHIYTAELESRRLPDILREMIGNLMRSRYVAFRLAQRDIKGQYSRSRVGMLWDFVDPLVLATVFYFLRRYDVFSTGELPMSYSLYVIYGLLIYQSFVEATLLSMDVAYRFRALLTQQKVSPEALLLSIFFRCSFFSAFRIVVMLLFTVFTDSFSILGAVTFVVAYPLIILSGMALGTFLAPFNTIYQDVGRFVRLIFVPLRFISPVLFVIPDTAVFTAINAVNPLATILPNLRLVAIWEPLADLALTSLHASILLVVGLLGWFLFHVTLPVLTERV